MCADMDQVAVSFPGEIGANLSRVESYARSSRSDSTQRAYAHDWAEFDAWCQMMGFDALPATPGAVLAYVTECADLRDGDGVPVYSPSTIGRRVAAINAMHTSSGLISPTVDPSVQTVMAGIRRELSARRPVRRARPLRLSHMGTVVDQLPTTWPACVTACRDRALLLVGFAGGFRRSELSALVWSDISPDESGVAVTVRSSKTDQESVGMVKAIPTAVSHVGLCPVCALAMWARVVLAEGDRTQVMAATLGTWNEQHVCQGDGLARAVGEYGDRPVFVTMNRHGGVGSRALSGHGVSVVVSSRAREAGLGDGFAGHSLRAGFVTEALRSGATYAEVMAQTGHANPATVDVYNRRENPFSGNAASRLGL